MSGETYLYLGRQYRLKIIKGGPEGVKLKGRFMEVIVTEKSRVKHWVKRWYLQIHELCHLVHHNHTNRFMELQEQMMSDWLKWKNRLEKLLA